VYYVATKQVTHFLTTTGIFREQALIGGMALLVLATFNLLMRNKFPGCGHDHAEGEAHHHHDEGTWLSRLITIMLLVTPVSLAAAYAPTDWTEKFKANQANSMMAVSAPVDGSGSTVMKAASGSQGYTLEDFKKSCPPNKDGQFPLSVANLWYSAGDPDGRRVLKGQTAVVKAQVVNDSFSKDKQRLRVFELEMTCCAADARPVSFPIDFGKEHPDYRESGWYEITGTIEFEEVKGRYTTLLKVIDMKASMPNRQNGGQAL
jgi:hypothetical protein